MEIFIRLPLNKYKKFNLTQRFPDRNKNNWTLRWNGAIQTKFQKDII